MRQLYSGLLLLSDFALSQNKLSDPYTEYDSLRFNFKNAEDKEITVWPEIYRFPIYARAFRIRCFDLSEPLVKVELCAVGNISLHGVHGARR